MEKQTYIIFTPSPDPSAKSLVVPLEDLQFQIDNLDVELYGDKQFKIKVVHRTKKWFNRFAELD